MLLFISFFILKVSDVTRDLNALTVEESGVRELAASSVSSDDPYAASQTVKFSRADLLSKIISSDS